MAREKQGYRDALRKVCRNFEGWIGAGRDKRIPATALARQIC